MKEIPSNSRRLVPAFLQGSHAQVTRASRRLIRRAIESQSIQIAVSTEECVSLDELGGLIVLDGDNRCPAIGSSNILLYPIPYQMWELATVGVKDFTKGSLDRERRILLIENLVYPALGDFWFALSCLAGQGDLPPQRGEIQSDRKAAVTMLRGLLRWWQDFVALSDRFSVAGFPAEGQYQSRYQWAGRLWELAGTLGVGVEERKEMRLCSAGDVCDWLLDLAVTGGR